MVKTVLVIKDKNNNNRTGKVDRSHRYLRGWQHSNDTISHLCHHFQAGSSSDTGRDNAIYRSTVHVVSNDVVAATIKLSSHTASHVPKANEANWLIAQQDDSAEKKSSYEHAKLYMCA